MPKEGWLDAAAAAAFLALALLAGVRRAKSPLAARLGLMSACLFAYEMAELLSLLDDARSWVYLGDAAATLAAPATLELFVGFLGKKRELRFARVAGRVWFVTLAVVSVAQLAWAPLTAFHERGVWAISMLVGVVPSFGLVAALVLRHLRKSRGVERARAQLLAGALVLGVGSVVTDLLSMAGFAVPRLSHFGLLSSSVLVALVTLKTRIVEGASSIALLGIAAASSFAVAALWVVYALAGDRYVLLGLGALVVVLVTLAAIRPLVAAASEERARARYVATLGRFSSQMAHDVRNPLAAIRGAAQFLREEHAQGRPLEPHVEFIDMIIERVDRIERLVQDYRRMGRLELLRGPVDLNDLVTDVLRGQRLDRSATGTTARADLDETRPVIRGDRDLLSFALENLVKNAVEAMNGSGELVVSTRNVGDARPPRARLTVRDHGPGMDVRTQEQALEGFFSTKPDGTGLGLVLAARVAEAHGGEIAIESEEGVGTAVSIELPVESLERNPEAPAP